MGILLAFAVGWVVGARAGRTGFDEVVEAASAVRESEEFHAFLDAARSHVGHTLKEIGAQLNGDSDEPLGVPDVLARVRSIMGKPGATSSAT